MVNSEGKRSDGVHHSLTGKQIYIVGPARLQNELMAIFLEDQTGAKGLTGEDLFAVQRIDDDHTAQPNLVLVDCQGKDLKNLLAELESHGREIPSQIFVALFNVAPGQGIESEAVRRGVRGFFYEQDPPDRFPKGVSAILEGELWVSREIMSKCILEQKSHDSAPKRNTADLTPREMEILAMVAIGAKNEQIADRLYISPHTVKTHIYNIFKKIGVPNRLQAALWAAKNL